MKKQEAKQSSYKRKDLRYLYTSSYLNMCRQTESIDLREKRTNLFPLSKALGKIREREEKQEIIGMGGIGKKSHSP